MAKPRRCRPTSAATAGDPPTSGAVLPPHCDGEGTREGSAITALRVRLEDLDAGDVVLHRRDGGQHEPAVVATIGEKQPGAQYGEVCRPATLRFVDGEVVAHRFCTATITVHDGPKLAAANADRSLVTNGGTTYNWRGTPPQKATAA